MMTKQVTWSLLMVILTAPALSWGQAGPPPRRDDPGRRDDPRREELPRRPGPPGLSSPGQFDMFRNFLDLVERYSQISHNSTSAGVAAVIYANDMLRPRGPVEAIKYFNDLLPKTADPVVQRTIRLHLIDLYKQAGELDKALEQVQILATAPSPAK
jgi:hypothetical protein